MESRWDNFGIMLLSLLEAFGIMLGSLLVPLIKHYMDLHIVAYGAPHGPYKVPIWSHIGTYAALCIELIGALSLTLCGVVYRAV